MKNTKVMMDLNGIKQNNGFKEVKQWYLLVHHLVLQLQMNV